VSTEVDGNGKVSANHSLVVGAPQTGASVDVGLKTEAPEGAITGSIDWGLGKHLEASINGYYKEGDGLGGFQPNGFTLHFGASLCAVEPCPSATVDINPQHTDATPH
jgi:hypothetical protein